jgi:hypothetical protein
MDGDILALYIKEVVGLTSFNQKRASPYLRCPLCYLCIEAMLKNLFHMKQLLVCLIFILLGTNAFFCQSSFCQSTFTFKYSTPNDEIPLHAVEIPDSGFIISSNMRRDVTSLGEVRILRINFKGDTLKSIHFKNDSVGLAISDLLKCDDGNYLGIGVKLFSQKSILWLIKMNADLKIIKDTTYSIGLIQIFYYFGLIDHFRNLIIYGSGVKNNPYMNPYIFKLTQDGDSITYKYLSNTSFQWAYSLIEKPDLTGYYMMILGHYQQNINTPGQILTFNYSLDEIKTDSIPGGLDLYFNSKVINNHEFILTGKHTIPFSNPRTDLLGILRLDNSLNVEKKTYFGPSDTINYPAYLHNLDFVDTNSIYYAGTVNQYIHGDFSINKSYFILGKFDSELHLQWQKYFGGDMYYTLWSMIATKDHGCLLLGSTYNYLTQNMERDILVIKVDSSGMLLSDNDITGVKLYNLIVYPNPGADYMAVETGQQAYGTDFTLYNVTGKPVIAQKILSSPFKINTQSLLPGIYFYRAVKGTHLIETGKWVKY